VSYPWGATPKPNSGFPCLTKGTSHYEGCIGSDRCKASGAVPKCLFGRWVETKLPSATDWTHGPPAGLKLKGDKL
jgi:hypothetical protein